MQTNVSRETTPAAPTNTAPTNTAPTHAAPTHLYRPPTLPTQTNVSRETQSHAASLVPASSSADLHVHTTLSDGSNTAEQVIKQAKQRGVSCLAITNHDTTAGLDAAIALGQQEGVQVLGGVEISAWDAVHQRKIHVLGLGLSEHAPAIAALCSPLLERRNANSLWQLDRLVEAGYNPNSEKALTLAAASTCLYKQHLMAALTSAPYVSATYRQLYRSLFKHGGICDRDITYVDAREATLAIVEDGGVAVLAHPGQLNSYEALPSLIDAGLGGIECYHPDHTSADHKLCGELAQRYHLMQTSGSDYHGVFGSAPFVGFGIPENVVMF